MAITATELPGASARGSNNQGQSVPSYPDGAYMLTGGGEAFFDVPVTLFCPAGGDVSVIPEARRAEVRAIFAAFPEGEEFDDFEDLSTLFVDYTVPEGGVLPFRVCAIAGAEERPDVLAVY